MSSIVRTQKYSTMEEFIRKMKMQPTRKDQSRENKKLSQWKDLDFREKKNCPQGQIRENSEVINKGRLKQREKRSCPERIQKLPTRTDYSRENREVNHKYRLEQREHRNYPQ